MDEAIKDMLSRWTDPQAEMTISTEDLGIERESADEVEFHIGYAKEGRQGRGFYLHVIPQTTKDRIRKYIPMNGARMFIHPVGRVSAKGWKEARAKVTSDMLCNLVKFHTK